MSYTYSDLRDIGERMWGEGVSIKSTDVKGIFDCTTSGHGGYLVDINLHPELKKYGYPTYEQDIKAFEEDYEAIKVIWLYPSLVNNKEWYEKLTIKDIVRYDSNNQFEKEFPYKRRN